MATKKLAPITRYNKGSNIFYFPETAGQTFKAGEPVYMVSAGTVTACAAGAQAFLGLAAADASGTTSALVAVDVICPGDMFVGNCYHATAASAVCVAGSQGGKFGYTVTSHVGVINIAETSTVGVKIVARVPEDSATDIYPRVVFAFISTYIQMDLLASV